MLSQDQEVVWLLLLLLLLQWKEQEQQQRSGRVAASVIDICPGRNVTLLISRKSKESRPLDAGSNSTLQQSSHLTVAVLRIDLSLLERGREVIHKCSTYFFALVGPCLRKQQSRPFLISSFHFEKTTLSLSLSLGGWVGLWVEALKSKRAHSSAIP